MTSKDPLPASFAPPPSPALAPLPPLAVLLVFSVLSAVHLFIVAVVPATTFPFLTRFAPIQVSFLVFLCGYSNTYSHALSHKYHQFSASRFYASHFAHLYPLYLLALFVHTFAFSSSTKPLLRFFASAAGLTPWVSPSLSFPPNDAPIIAYTLLPCLALAYLIFPILLDLLPRYDTANVRHVQLTIPVITCLASLQAFWLSHLPNTDESTRSIMFVDILAYLPFLAHLPAFALGMATCLCQLAKICPSIANPYPTFDRTSASLVVTSTLVLMLIFRYQLYPLTELYSAESAYSFMFHPFIYGLVLVFYAAVVRTSVSFSFHRWSPGQFHPPPADRDPVLASQVRLYHTDTPLLYHFSGFGTTLYMIAAPVWRSLGAAVCPIDKRTTARVAYSAFRHFACPGPSEVVAPTPQPFEWFSIWPWVHGRTNDLTNVVASAAERLATPTTIMGPRVAMLVYLPVLLLVGVAVYCGIQKPLAATLIAMHERFLQAAEDGRLVHSPWLARIANAFYLTPEQRKPKRDGSVMERVARVVLYYAGMVSFLCFVFHFSLPLGDHIAKGSLGSWFCWFPNSMYSCDENPTNDGPAGLLGTFGIGSTFATNVVDILRWVSLLTLPTMILNVVGQVVFPRAIWKRLPTISEMMQQGKVVDEEAGAQEIGLIADKTDKTDKADKTKLDLDFTLYFRYVTRGDNARLVSENAKRAAAVLKRSGLPREMWRVEVVTDQGLNLSDEIDDPGVYEIVVPVLYEADGGALYKARALNYAITASLADEMDWIVHLDEETRFDEDTVRAIMLHCGRERYLTCVAKTQRWPRIGQGPILYGRGMADSTVAGGGDVDNANWVTTLADSGRVSDDCGRYRIQYECGEVWVGMHGSFVVACNCVEKNVTFDHGVEGSIAEDAFFGMIARSRGVRFAWVDALMFEQSPFTLKDFIKQRARWLVGGLRVVSSKRIPWRLSVVMRVLTTLWATMPLTYAALLVGLLMGSGSAEMSRMNWYYYYGLLPLLAAASVWNYVFGFCVTFSVRRLGIVRFATLLYAQVVLAPVFGVMEVAAVSYALANFRRLAVGFHVVQKELRHAGSNGAGEMESLLHRRQRASSRGGMSSVSL